MRGWLGSVVVVAALLAGCSAGPASPTDGTSEDPGEGLGLSSTTTGAAAGAGTTGPSPDASGPSATGQEAAGAGGEAASTSTGDSQDSSTDTSSSTDSSSSTGSPTSSSSGSSSSTGSSSPTGSSSGSTSPQPAPRKDADELALVVGDMPSGWWGDAPRSDPRTAAAGSVDDSKSSLSRSSGSPWLVDTLVNVFATPAEALQYYRSAEDDFAGGDVVDVQAGDEAFMVVHYQGYWEEGWIVKQNVVWSIYVSGDGAAMSPSTPSLMQKAAAKL